MEVEVTVTLCLVLTEGRRKNGVEAIAKVVFLGGEGNSVCLILFAFQCCML